MRIASMTGQWCSSEMSERYSHPPENGREGVALEDHLRDVAERVSYIIPPEATTPAGESLQKVVETLAWVHDLGKATTYFQEYLLEEKDQEPRMLRYHAPMGAFAAYYALDARGFATETCLAGFVAVGKHHGHLPDVTKYVFDRAYRRDNPPEQNSTERKQTAIAKQLKDINDKVPQLAKRVLASATEEEGTWSEFADDYSDLLDEIADTVATSGDAPGVDREALSESCYALVLQCWSGLVLADKTSAAGAESAPETYAPETPELERLDQYVTELESDTDADPDGSRSERLNYYRSKARRDVLEKTTDTAEDGDVLTLTLPTGMGKTLTGLSAAFALRDRSDAECVVYALPFTSIIDQVVEELQTIYRTDTDGRLLTAHHHLAETTIQSDDDSDADEADRSDDVAGLLGESWRAGLTVSTFVQLFESLAGPSNRQSMKLPALRDSVVVLDEPQSLPLDWWRLVPRLVEMLTEQYDAKVISMTATQPQLFEDATRLVDDPDTYFEAVERVNYELHDSIERYIADQSGPLSYDSAATELVRAVESGESTLAVCNTIDSARELTDRFCDRVPEVVDIAEIYADVLRESGSASAVDAAEVARRIATAERPAVLHLSTRLRPADRLTLIEIAKTLTERNASLTTISTQLVEAGVDISFERVYRDLGPIDSIVQAAGRCNRSFERERGRVVLWWLDTPGDQEKTPAEAVYNRGPSLLPVAAETIESVRESQGVLDERAVARTAVKQYYRRLREDKRVGKEAYAEYVDNARADKLADCSLIDQRLAADVCVVRTQSDRELVESIRDAHTEYDFEELDHLLDETKTLQVSVPYYREDSEIAQVIQDLPQILEERGLYQLDIREHSSYFDRRTGFVVPENTVDHQFL